MLRDEISLFLESLGKQDLMSFFSEGFQITLAYLVDTKLLIVSIYNYFIFFLVMGIFSVHEVMKWRDGVRAIAEGMW